MCSFMNLHLLVLLPLVLAFGSCTSNQNQKSTLFLKKVECEKYAERTRQEYRETGPLMPGGDAQTNYYVERIFYSPKKDSCVCVLGNKLEQPNGEDAYSILIVDALTKKLLLAKEYRSGDKTGLVGDVAGMADDIDMLVKRYE